MNSKMLARKFLLPVMGVVIVALNRKLNLGLTVGDLAVIAGMIASFVFGEGAVDAAHAWGGQAADAGKDMPEAPKPPAA